MVNFKKKNLKYFTLKCLILLITAHKKRIKLTKNANLLRIEVLYDEFTYRLDNPKCYKKNICCRYDHILDFRTIIFHVTGVTAEDYPIYYSEEASSSSTNSPTRSVEIRRTKPISYVKPPIKRNNRNKLKKENRQAGETKQTAGH